MDKKKIVFALMSTLFILLTLKAALATGEVNITIQNSPVTVINNNFYGVNTGSSHFLSNYTVIYDTSGTANSTADYNTLRSAFNWANMNSIRVDSNLYQTYTGFNNKDLEYWRNASKTTNKDNFGTSWLYFTSCSGSQGCWAGQTQGAPLCDLNRTSDAHSGLWAMQINNTNQSNVLSNCTPYYQWVLPNATNYNFSAWVKSNFSITLMVVRNSTRLNLCSVNTAPGTNWTRYSCNFTTPAQTTIAFLIIVNQSSLAIVDDLNLTETATNKIAVVESKYTDTNKISDKDIRKNIVAWAAGNGTRINYVLAYTPYYLANISERCNSTTYTCSINNYIEWAQLIQSDLQYVTSNGLYSSMVDVEVWNEPDLSNFLFKQVGDAENLQLRANYYNEIYNHTYWAVKAVYPGMAVGGPAVSNIYMNSSRGITLFQNFLSNFSQQFQFLSIHAYASGVSGMGDTISKAREYADNNMTFYGVNIKNVNVSITEWNTQTYTEQVNNDTVFGAMNSYAYMKMLRNYGNNTRMFYYVLTADRNYTSSGYSEYPIRYAMFSMPQFENTNYSSFNVTQKYATRHAAGSSVLNTTTDNNDVQAIYSRNANLGYLTVTNLANTQYNVTITSDAAAVINNLNQSSITASGGKINLGAFQPYETRYYSVDPTGGPYVYFTSPTPANGIVYSDSMNYQVIASDINLDTITVTLTDGTRTQTASGTSSFIGTFTELTNGAYTLTATANDTLGQSNTTTATFTVSGHAASGGGGGGSAHFSEEDCQSYAQQFGQCYYLKDAYCIAGCPDGSECINLICSQGETANLAAQTSQTAAQTRISELWDKVSSRFTPTETVMLTAAGDEDVQASAEPLQQPSRKQTAFLVVLGMIVIFAFWMSGGVKIVLTAYKTISKINPLIAISIVIIAGVLIYAKMTGKLP